MLSTDSQTDKQTNRQTKPSKNITSFAKEVTRSTRRVQTSLTEADHYSYIAQCKNVEPWWWKADPKGLESLQPSSGYATAVMVFFAHFLIFECKDHHQNLISSSLCYPGPHNKFSF